MTDTEEIGRETAQIVTPRYRRRFSDNMLIAFHQACDQGDYDIAERLLHILETMLNRRPAAPDRNRSRPMKSLIAAHERLWHLKHPDQERA